MVLTRGGPQSPRSKAGAKWLSKIRKGQVAPKGLHLLLTSLNLESTFMFQFLRLTHLSVSVIQVHSIKIRKFLNLKCSGTSHCIPLTIELCQD